MTQKHQVTRHDPDSDGVTRHRFANGRALRFKGTLSREDVLTLEATGVVTSGEAAELSLFYDRRDADQATIDRLCRALGFTYAPSSSDRLQRLLVWIEASAPDLLARALRPLALDLDPDAFAFAAAYAGWAPGEPLLRGKASDEE